MEKIEFNKLLLKTAFACMSCDGDIDIKEVSAVKRIHQESKIFGDIDLYKELDSLFFEINQDSLKFIRNYFSELTSVNLTRQEELNLIEVAISTIKSDDKVEYSEIKFFKVIRSKLKIDDKSILSIHPDFEEYLEKEILSESYLSRLQNNFFDNYKLSEFDPQILLKIDKNEA
jgi:hypothetical protein